MFLILVSCLDLGNLIFDPVDVIFDRGIAIFTLGIVVFDLDIAIFGLGIAHLNSQSILLNELSRFEITTPNDRPRLLLSALPHIYCCTAAGRTAMLLCSTRNSSTRHAIRANLAQFD